MELLLASASPRRAELLTQLGFSFRVCPADIDERPLAAERPDAYVLRIASEKALAVAAGGPPGLVLAADTAIDLDGCILGKPQDREAAAVMLRALSGRSHRVLTAIALCRGELLHSEVVVTEVQFAELSDADIRAYVATGEADDKAGSYAIQGRAAQFVRRIDGSYSAVVGLPLYETVIALRSLGYRAATPHTE